MSRRSRSGICQPGGARARQGETMVAQYLPSIRKRPIIRELRSIYRLWSIRGRRQNASIPSAPVAVPLLAILLLAAAPVPVVRGAAYAVQDEPAQSQVTQEENAPVASD